jgi:predicted phosphodiesterase
VTELSKDLEAAYQAADRVPKGWEPYSEQIDQIGSAVVRLPRPDFTHHDLLVGAGFDPAEWQISGPIQARKWMAYDGRWLHYFKFEVVQGESDELRDLHVEELTKAIRRRTKAGKIETGGKDAWAYVASDWQVGKREGSDGTPQTVDRVLHSLELAVAQVRDLRRVGRKMPTGAVIGLGDLVEGCTGFYPAQEFLVDATRREQNRIARELITHAVDTLSPLFDEFLVATVGGNHGENRRDGRAFTTPGDNDDLAAFEAVREAFTRAGHDEIDWEIPEDELSIGFMLGGVQIGATHGHLFKTGQTAQKKALEWWKGQDFGFQATRDARILLSGHFHHFSLVTYGTRTAIQAPAMDPGSAWYRQSTGEESPAGVLTLRLDSEEPAGYDDLRILSPYGAQAY